MAARYLIFTLALILISSGTDSCFAQRASTQTGTNSPSGLSNSLSNANSLSNSSSISGGLSNPSGQRAASALGTGPRSRQLTEKGFVGRSEEDVRETFQNLNGRQSRRATFDFLIENLNEMRESRQRRREQNRPAPPVHVNLRPTFDFPRRSAVELVTGMQMRLDKVMIERGHAGPQVALDDRTATLTGTVRTAHDKALIEKLVAIEPGVSRVENHLVVAE